MQKRIAHNKLTQEQAINKLVEIQGNSYGYDKSVYVDSLTPMDIYCFTHKEYFPQTFKAHKKSGCPKCGRERQIESAKKGQEQFIKELKDIHGDIFDLSRLSYKNTKTEVELGCEKHGFFKRKPSDLLEGFSCQKCKLEKSKYNNRDLFIEESIKLFGDITDHSNVRDISAKTKVDLHCTLHDHSFTLSVGNRLSGQKCPKCAEENYNSIRTLPLEEYYKRCNIKHDNKYTYTDDYKGLREDITFYCSIHGENRRNAYSHVQGCGCKYCPSEDSKTDRLGRDGYIKLSKGKPTSLYLIKCFNKDEEFYKIGKTFQGIENRFTKRNMPYKYEIIFEYSSSADEIWDLEKVLHTKYKEYRYKTVLSFEGHTESYNLLLPIKEIIK